MDSLSAFFRVAFGREEAIVIDNACDYRTLGVQSSCRKARRQVRQWHSCGKRRCIKFSVGTICRQRITPEKDKHAQNRERVPGGMLGREVRGYKTLVVC